MRLSELKLSDYELAIHNIGTKYGWPKQCHNCDEECDNLYYYRADVFFCWWCINDHKHNL